MPASGADDARRAGSTLAAVRLRNWAVDPQFVIEYEVDLNTILYANQNGVNTLAVAAVDGAGNRSPLSNVFSKPFEGCVF